MQESDRYDHPAAAGLAEALPFARSHTTAPLLPQDFKKHCEAADMVARALPAMHEEVMSVVDLIFRCGEGGGPHDYEL